MSKRKLKITDATLITKGKWNKGEVDLLLDCLSKGMDVKEIETMFKGARTLAQIKGKTKSKLIQDALKSNSLDEDITEVVTDEQLEIVKDVLIKRTAEQKAKNSRTLMKFILGLTMVSAILWKWG